MATAEIAVRPHDCQPRHEPVEIGARWRQPLCNISERQAHFADIERGIQVALQRVEVACCGKIAPGDFADQEEVRFAQVGGELLDRAAEIARLLERDMFTLIASSCSYR